MIAINALSVAFGSVAAISHVDLVVPNGEIVLMGGASGCGKSTLLRAVAGLIPHAVPATMTGDIWIGGRRVADMPLTDLAQRVGLVFQNPTTQLFNLTVREEVAFGPYNLGLNAADVDRRVAWALDVTGLAGKGARDVRLLSGGERQRVAIAAVLAMRPLVLALDEPMAALDVDGSRRLVDVLHDLNRSEGTTIVIAEHRLREAAQVARRTVLMDEGRVTADGPTAAVLGERALLRRLGLRRPALTPLSDWEALIAPGRPAGGAPIVELRGVDVTYVRDRVLQDVSFEIREGECLALVGDNGSGKSTVARLLAGMIRPSRGACRWHVVADAGTGVGILLQEPRDQLFCESVEDEVAFGPRNCGRLAPGLVDGMLAAADLEALRPRPIHTLSNGQLHRTALASVLALRPRLLILDEPTVGQDWRHLEQLMDAVEHLRASGSAVLLISHDFKLIHRHASRVLLLRGGRVVAEGIPQDAPAERD